MHGEVIHPLCTGLCTSFKTDQSELTAYLYNDNLEDTKKKKKVCCKAGMRMTFVVHCIKLLVKRQFRADKRIKDLELCSYCAIPPLLSPPPPQ